jgi:hypothetical protein
MSNLPLVVVVLVAITAKSLLAIRQEPRTALIALAALVLCAAIPIGTWIAWTKYQFGDLTGSTTKIALLSWTRKPFEDWLQHPIFTRRGLWLFWSNLMASFWRGEVSWHGRPPSWGSADTFFAVSSLVLLGSAIVGLPRRSGLSSFQQQAIGVAILVFLAGVAFLALLSKPFAGLSLFYCWPSAKWRANSVRHGVRLWHRLPLAPKKRYCTTDCHRRPSGISGDVRNGY